jgi:hypothetical protein
MPAARSNRDRVLQIARWLTVTFPTPYPTTVRCVKKIAALPGASPMHRQTGDDGSCWVEYQKIIIRIAVRKGIHRPALIDTLIHEWAHAVLMKEESDKIGRHDDAWGVVYARIYHRYVDDGGFRASEDY